VADSVVASPNREVPLARLAGGTPDERQHHLRVVRSAAVAVGTIGRIEVLEVELLDRFDPALGGSAKVDGTAG
jgi:hypothetical protein